MKIKKIDEIHDWPDTVDHWQNLTWFKAWSVAYKQVYVLVEENSFLPFCIDSDGVKRYASWQVTDFVSPIGDWSIFLNSGVEILHLTNELPYSKCDFEENSEHYSWKYVTSLPTSKNLIPQLKRKRRMISDSLRYVCYDSDIPNSIFDAIILHKQRRFPATEIMPSLVHFLKLLKSSRWPLQVHALLDGNEFVSGNIGFTTNVGLGFWIVSFNQKYEKFCPGHLLIESMLSRAMSTGVAVDFMLGNEAYKDKWQPINKSLFSTTL